MPTESINLTKFGWHAVYNLSLSINNMDSYQKCHRMRTTTSPQDLEYCVYTLSGGLTPTAPLLTMSTFPASSQFSYEYQSSSMRMPALVQQHLETLIPNACAHRSFKSILFYNAVDIEIASLSVLMFYSLSTLCLLSPLTRTIVSTRSHVRVDGAVRSLYSSQTV